MQTTVKERATADLHRSDGSELIPAEVQANTRRDGSQAPGSFPEGYTVDDEGITNNYAIEPAIYPAVYPTPEQQRRYVGQGAAALLLVTLTLITAFAVS